MFLLGMTKKVHVSLLTPLAAPVDMVFSNPSDYSGLVHLAGGHSLFHSNFLRLFRLLRHGVGHRKDAQMQLLTDQLHI